jgi:hypothetical protein
VLITWRRLLLLFDFSVKPLRSDNLPITVLIPLTCAASLGLSFSLYGLTALCWALAVFSFLILYIVGNLGRGMSPSQGRYLHMTTRTQNKSTHTSMPRVGLQPTIPVFERAETVHSLDRAATVIDVSRPAPYNTFSTARWLKTDRRHIKCEVGTNFADKRRSLGWYS